MFGKVFLSFFQSELYKGMHSLCLLLILLFLADISTVICDKADKAQVLLGNVERRETPALRRIILMDTFDGALLEQAQSCGVHIQAMAEVEVGERGAFFKVQSPMSIVYSPLHIIVIPEQEA